MNIQGYDLSKFEFNEVWLYGGKKERYFNEQQSIYISVHIINTYPIIFLLSKQSEPKSNRPCLVKIGSS